MTRKVANIHQENFQLRKDVRYLRATLELRTQERDAARAALSNQNWEKSLAEQKARHEELTTPPRKFKRIG